MDSLFHFVFPLIAALAARIHVKHGILSIVGVSLATVLLDLDVFAIHRATLHNVFVTVLIPIVLIFLAFKYEKKENTYCKTMSVMLLLFLVSHPILDMFTEGGVQFLYPLLNEKFSFMGINIAVGLPTGMGSLINGPGIGLLIYFALILCVLFIEDFIKYFQKEPVKKALIDTYRKEEKKLKKSI